jgi:hypothetical protein
MNGLLKKATVRPAIGCVKDTLLTAPNSSMQSLSTRVDLTPLRSAIFFCSPFFCFVLCLCGFSFFFRFAVSGLCILVNGSEF